MFYKIYRIWSKSRRKDDFNFKGCQFIYKISWRGGLERLRTEFHARSVPPHLFKGLWHFYEPVLESKRIYIARSRIIHSSMNERDCDRVILRLLDNVSDGCEYREWDKTLDQSALNIIMHNMSEDVRAFIDSALSGIKLPITGAHGDLIQQNFLGSSYDVKIIDWEFYREHGSIVSDVLRYFMVKRSRFNGVSFLSPESLNVNLLPNSLHKLVKLNSQFEIDTQLKVLGVIGNGTAFWNEELGVKQAKKIDRFMSEYMMLNNFGSLAY